MPTVVVIPVRSFSVGKQRLGTALTIPQRARLAGGMADRVGAAVESAGLLPLFVTADGEVAEWATGTGFPFIQDPDRGLDAAAATGASWAEASGSRWVVLHSDLPLLDATDVEALGAAVAEGRDVIAPSSDGGTSALSTLNQIEFAYGAGSFHRHLARMEDPVVVTSTGLLHDLDSPIDLRSALRHRRGSWIRDVLA